MSPNIIVVRVDGRDFLRFSEVHEFDKPNDLRALELMNDCAKAVLEQFPDVIFSYGYSDEYSETVSAVVSFFSLMYTRKWDEFFPHKEMKYSPYFDGRAVCYPSCEILRDYLAWRQVDCHINNLCDTCFWMLVKSGKSKSDAQNNLKGTQTPEKNELLDQLSGSLNYYNSFPLMSH